MSVVLLLSIAIGFSTFAALERLPRWSPRAAMIRRIGGGPEPAVLPGLAGRLRRLPLTRQLAPGQFRLLQGVLAAGAALALCGPWWLTGGAPDWAALAAYPLLLGLLPELWLALQLRRRQVLLARAYPDLLSHLAVQMRAGAGLEQALAGSMAALGEPLKGEIRAVVDDLRYMELPAALDRFAQRCGLPEYGVWAGNMKAHTAAGMASAAVMAAEAGDALAVSREAGRRRNRQALPIMVGSCALLLLAGLVLYFFPLLT